MAPEIFKNSNYNSKADIWSIGIVFYEMLFGDLPFFFSFFFSFLLDELLQVNINSFRNKKKTN